jgi:hypothetical protein
VHASRCFSKMIWQYCHQALKFRSFSRLKFKFESLLYFRPLFHLERLTISIRQHSARHRLALYYEVSSLSGGMGKTGNVRSGSRARRSRRELHERYVTVDRSFIRRTSSEAYKCTESRLYVVLTLRKGFLPVFGTD